MMKHYRFRFINPITILSFMICIKKLPSNIGNSFTSAIFIGILSHLSSEVGPVYGGLELRAGLSYEQIFHHGNGTDMVRYEAHPEVTGTCSSRERSNSRVELSVAGVQELAVTGQESRELPCIHPRISIVKDDAMLRVSSSENYIYDSIH